jgi:hypothetical protein
MPLPLKAPAAPLDEPSDPLVPVLPVRVPDEAREEPLNIEELTTLPSPNPPVVAPDPVLPEV